MHKFTLPTKNINSDIFFEQTGWTLSVLENELYIVGDCTRDQAEQALANHNPPKPQEPTVAQKLASVGLSIDDLKTALGL
jgi:hypothetical protein